MIWKREAGVFRRELVITGIRLVASASGSPAMAVSLSEARCELWAKIFIFAIKKKIGRGGGHLFIKSILNFPKKSLGGITLMQFIRGMQSTFSKATKKKYACCVS